MEIILPLTQDQIKWVNRLTILQIIQKFGEISKSEIARYSGLSPATVSNFSEALIADGLINEKGIGESTGGRRPTVLTLDEQRHFMIGIFVSKYGISSCGMTLSGTVIEEDDLSLFGDRSGSRILDNVCRIVQGMMKSFSERLCLGVGIAVEAEPYGQDSFLMGSNVLIRKQEWLDRIRGLGCSSVIIEMKSSATAISEKLYGKAKDAFSFFVLDIGEQITSAYYYQDGIVKGFNQGAGNIAHVRVSNRAIKCKCGKTGCFNAVASTLGIEERFLIKLKEGNTSSLVEDLKGDLTAVTAKQIYDYAVLGDRLSLSVIRETGGYIGTVLSYVINAINPEVVLITGMYNANSIMNREINKSLNKLSAHRNLNRVYIGEGGMYRYTPALGAAALVAHENLRLSFRGLQ
ncbi:Sugar kinase of the NBD/HSP70 family, may contain an N-terminal HTH domain [Acidaminobacter hydrogenoformans DSM 2784]|uniref:Sugar kinase of the NBD/HSP70 family, may contain an N-terminal HTH domain n=1 Tax=Acidaminobacter hydrogenoformans DSM 2784 TaxID=1120920 RepID=A0A1G5RTN5_9FIRM|nr:Sugar kinase of the NBD/HSP70 family, may contain an N-terminal HTH domain [Acidaminobacter hydrogenoformans DSM 2784]